MNGAKPLISVTISAYNHEDYVQAAIRSIINQTYRNLELIIVDDGSTDSTWAKIQELKAECEKRFVRVDFSTQKNAGLCATANIIRQKTRGTYTYSIASDDVAYPEAIENLYDAIISGDYVLAVGNEDFINAHGDFIGIDNQFRPQPLERAKYKTFCDLYNAETTENYFQAPKFGSYKSLIKRNYIPNGYLILVSAIKGLTYTQEAPLEDWFLHLQLSKAGKYKFVDKVLFSYRLHGHNTISDQTRIFEMSKKTINYEEKMVQKSPKLQALFQKATLDKTYLNLGLIKLYKRKFLNRKIYCLKLFSREIILKEKLIKEIIS